MSYDLSKIFRMVVATMLKRHMNFKMTVFAAFEDTLPVCAPYLLAKSQRKTRANGRQEPMKQPREQLKRQMVIIVTHSLF